MSTIAGMAEVAALVGDPARTGMLNALMQGRALTAKELALTAGIAAPTASGHLGRLAAAGLVAVTTQGRHRYYRLASPRVAALLESLSVVASFSQPSRPRVRSPQEEALRLARTCYDHLAGRLGVGIANALVAQGHVVLGEDGGEVTAAGAAFLAVTFPRVQGRGELESSGWNGVIGGSAEPARGSSAIAAWAVRTSMGVR